MRLQNVNWQRFTFCPRCAGSISHDLIAYLKSIRAKTQPPLFK